MASNLEANIKWAVEKCILHKAGGSDETVPKMVQSAQKTLLLPGAKSKTFLPAPKHLGKLNWRQNKDMSPDHSGPEAASSAAVGKPILGDKFRQLSFYIRETG